MLVKGAAVQESHDAIVRRDMRLPLGARTTGPRHDRKDCRQHGLPGLVTEFERFKADVTERASERAPVPYQLMHRLDKDPRIYGIQICH